MLDPVTLAEPALDAAATETVQLLRERTERQSHALRRRPLGLVEAPADAPATAAVRTVRNTTADRLVTFHFFEPLERFRVVVRTPRIHEDFVITIPHAGVWVTAQAHEPVQQREAEGQQQAG